MQNSIHHNAFHLSTESSAQQNCRFRFQKPQGNTLYPYTWHRPAPTNDKRFQGENVNGNNSHRQSEIPSLPNTVQSPPVGPNVQNSATMSSTVAAGCLSMHDSYHGNIRLQLYQPQAAFSPPPYNHHGHQHNSNNNKTYDMNCDYYHHNDVLSRRVALKQHTTSNEAYPLTQTQTQSQRTNQLLVYHANNKGTQSKHISPSQVTNTNAENHPDAIDRLHRTNSNTLQPLVNASINRVHIQNEVAATSLQIVSNESIRTSQTGAVFPNLPNAPLTSSQGLPALQSLPTTSQSGPYLLILPNHLLAKTQLCPDLRNLRNDYPSLNTSQADHPVPQDKTNSRTNRHKSADTASQSHCSPVDQNRARSDPLFVSTESGNNERITNGRNVESQDSDPNSSHKLSGSSIESSTDKIVSSDVALDNSQTSHFVPDTDSDATTTKSVMSDSCRIINRFQEDQSSICEGISPTTHETRQNLSITKIVVKDNELIKCGICDLPSFETFNDLLAHLILRHSQMNSIPCRHCGEFLDKQRIFRHLEVKHKAAEGIRFFCGGLAVAELKCRETFRSLHDLWQHMKTSHSKEKDFDCEGCEKHFPSIRNYICHFKNVVTHVRSKNGAKGTQKQNQTVSSSVACSGSDLRNPRNDDVRNESKDRISDSGDVPTNSILPGRRHSPKRNPSLRDTANISNSTESSSMMPVSMSKSKSKSESKDTTSVERVLPRRAKNRRGKWMVRIKTVPKNADGEEIITAVSQSQQGIMNALETVLERRQKRKFDREDAWVGKKRKEEIKHSWRGTSRKGVSGYKSKYKGKNKGSKKIYRQKDDDDVWCRRTHVGTKKIYRKRKQKRKVRMQQSLASPPYGGIRTRSCLNNSNDPNRPPKEDTKLTRRSTSRKSATESKPTTFESEASSDTWEDFLQRNKDIFDDEHDDDTSSTETRSSGTWSGDSILNSDHNSYVSGHESRMERSGGDSDFDSEETRTAADSTDTSNVDCGFESDSVSKTEDNNTLAVPCVTAPPFHFDALRFTCSLCHVTFNSIVLFRIHLASHATKAPNDLLPVDPAIRTYFTRCGLCDVPLESQKGQTSKNPSRPCRVKKGKYSYAYSKSQLPTRKTNVKVEVSELIKASILPQHAYIFENAPDQHASSPSHSSRFRGSLDPKGGGEGSSSSIWKSLNPVSVQNSPNHHHCHGVKNKSEFTTFIYMFQMFGHGDKMVSICPQVRL